MTQLESSGPTRENAAATCYIFSHIFLLMPSFEKNLYSSARGYTCNADILGAPTPVTSDLQ